MIYRYFHSTNHVIEDFPQLLARVEEKREKNIHMMMTEPYDRPIDPTNVRVKA